MKAIPQQLSGLQLVALKNQIVQGFNESHWRELGAITEMLDAEGKGVKFAFDLSATKIAGKKRK